ncbi:MAG: putative threonine efflux protein [Rhodobacteraceae bacterium HLUCCA08]|nr:MAG: putative threonine efflux protein [Rhodobacteraceae bacterium HLUCCA08]
MTLDPLYGFVFLGMFSPGPNVILLTASGARFGFAASLPHLAGVVLGVGIIGAVTGFGLGTLITAIPALRIALTVAAAAWILVMAWQLWHADPTHPRSGERPWRFGQAVVFQWINPKIWAIALAATEFVADLPPADMAARLGFTFMPINLLVCLFWTAAGTLLAILLTNRTAWRGFMRVMAVALAGFSIAVFL